jgi:tetratricopeptide (TPR) repeat protein
VALFVAVLVIVGVVFAVRPLQAWWDDDEGNRALVAGNASKALAWFDAGLRAQPNWSVLHEDRGRALLAQNPRAALAEFERAACGSPCTAEAGDALMALGRTNEAIDDYVQAKAVGRVTEVATRLEAAHHYAAALAIESSLLARLTNDFVDRSDLAAVYAAMGKIDVSAATSKRRDSQARKDEKAAIDAFAHATALAPLNEDYLLSYGFAQMRWGSPLEAHSAFERLLQLHPGQVDAQAALARMKDTPKGLR